MGAPLEPAALALGRFKIMRRSKQLIEFKGNTLSVIVVTLRSLQLDELTKTAHELFGGESFFEGDAALLEVGEIDLSETVNWGALHQLFARHGLRVIGVSGANDALRESALAAGLPDLHAVARPVRKPVASPPQQEEISAVFVPEIASPVKEQAPPPRPIAVQALVIDRALRSGQQVYARGGDLVVLAPVSSGAELIADGSIHVYAPLRGRALAGAKGALDARIFTTRFEAELVSIAGVYRTFEAGVPDNLAGKAVQIQLSEHAGEEISKLSIVALKIN
jgi:septum site-determining protein MinC